MEALMAKLREWESKYKDLEGKNINLQKEVDRLNGLLKQRDAEIEKLKNDLKNL